ncbi:Membrane protein tms1 [Basidiobolus ranarum]|uniref:Membrane protein tms1 n=1 Tax=Basidiobolus ranarum TaxID=34480 RepID=A0ABR2W9J4_9FUNG
MGCIVSCLSMQICSCCTSTACSCASKIFKIQGSIATRLSYAGIFLVSSLLSWLMLTDWAMKTLSDITYGYLTLHCPEGRCYGAFAVHRICFALALFHFILSALVWNVNDSREPRASIQNGWWGPKVFAWLLLTVIAFFIPNGFFAFWGNYIAIIGASFFILVQLALLVDFAHSWSESCIEKWENDSNDKWKYIVVGSSIGMFIIVLALIGVMYAYFGRNGCGLNQFFITFNLVLCVLITFLSVHPQIQEANSKSGLSQASMVAIYCSWLILSAVMNEPVVGDDYYCNPIRSRSTRHTAVLFGAMFTIVAIVYSTSRAATQSSSLISSTDYDPVNSAAAVPLIDSQPGKSKGMKSEALMAAIESGALPASALNDAEHSEDDDDDEPGTATDDEKHGCQYNYTFFHIIFAIGAMYVSMLLTNWNSYSDTSEMIRIGASWPAVWVKVVSSWFCIGLYSWSLLGPILLPDRDWS